MTEDQLTALGDYLENYRQASGLTKAQAAKRASVSRSTWDTLTYGYISRQGRRDPVTPKLGNVIAAAVAVGAPPLQAARLAGYKLTKLPRIIRMSDRYVALSEVPVPELLAELQRRSTP